MASLQPLLVEEPSAGCSPRTDFDSDLHLLRTVVCRFVLGFAAVVFVVAGRRWRITYSSLHRMHSQALVQLVQP